MKLEELAARIAAGDGTAELIEALGQRLVRPPEDWEWETEAGTCTCGLLLVELPRPVRLDRVIVVPGVVASKTSRALVVPFTMTHAHVAHPADGRARCAECWEEDGPCAEHEAHMCDTPCAEQCAQCYDAALPGQDHCKDHRPHEDEWDKDRYLGL